MPITPEHDEVQFTKEVIGEVHGGWQELREASSRGDKAWQNKTVGQSIWDLAPGISKFTRRPDADKEALSAADRHRCVVGGGDHGHS